MSINLKFIQTPSVHKAFGIDMDNHNCPGKLSHTMFTLGTGNLISNF